MNTLPVRKRTRLESYSYSQTGAYFTTICARNKQHLFGSIVGAATCRPHICLSEYGNVVNSAIQNIGMIYSSVAVSHYVIMPNHVHMLIEIVKPGRQVAAPTISTIVGNMKRAVSIQVGEPIWQKSFHDHVIRDQADYHRIAQYIDENPIRWEEDCYFTKPEDTL